MNIVVMRPLTIIVSDTERIELHFRKSWVGNACLRMDYKTTASFDVYAMNVEVSSHSLHSKFMMDVLARYIFMYVDKLIEDGRDAIRKTDRQRKNDYHLYSPI